ncbi:hypothetical protein TNCV_3831961 [Trichonephila clavipes]|nr:hypothetical protein TNCV_3831961 [Trichonephila clavipes]
MKITTERWVELLEGHQQLRSQAVNQVFPPAKMARWMCIRQLNEKVKKKRKEAMETPNVGPRIGYAGRSLIYHDTVNDDGTIEELYATVFDMMEDMF